MDLSGWLKDISSNSIYFCFAAQNHVYGCLSLLEQIEDGEVILDISNNQDPVIVYKDMSDEFQIFHLQTSFHLIGNMFGFCDDISGTFLGWNEEYRQNWIHIFHHFQDRIESLETGFYNLFKSKFLSDGLVGKCAFEAIVNGKEITEEMKNVYLDSNSSQVNSKQHRRDYTYRTRRVTTPMYRRRGFNKTRKQKL